MEGVIENRSFRAVKNLLVLDHPRYGRKDGAYKI